MGGAVGFAERGPLHSSFGGISFGGHALTLSLEDRRTVEYDLPATVRDVFATPTAELLERWGSPDKDEVVDGSLRALQWDVAHFTFMVGEMSNGTRLIAGAGLNSDVGPLFDLEFALALAGLDPEFPYAPTCTPEGEVSWPDWPGVGRVRITYPIRSVVIQRNRPRGGGSEVDNETVARLFKVA